MYPGNGILATGVYTAQELLISTRSKMLFIVPQLAIFFNKLS